MLQQRQKKKLRQTNIVLLGPRSSGKTSLVRWLCGKEQLSDERQEKLVAKLESQPQSNLVDTYYTTLKREHHYFYHKKYHFNVFDLPGESDLVRIQNTICVQNVIFVVSAKENDFNESYAEIKHILNQCELLNVKRILFAINHMDHWPSCNWSQPKYDHIVKELTTLCNSMFKYKKEPLSFGFAPTGALEGQNILKRSAVEILVNHGVAKWIRQNDVRCLMEVLEGLMLGKTKTQRESKYQMKKKPLRFTVIGTIPRNEEVDENDEDEENVAGVFAYVHSGKIRRNTKLILQPRQCFTVVKSISYFTPRQFEQHKQVQHLYEDQNEEEQLDVPTHASAGSLCYIQFHNKERIKVPIGTVGGEPITKKIPQEAESMIVKIKVIHKNLKLHLRCSYTCISGMQKFTLQLSEIQALFDQRKGKVNLQNLPVKSFEHDQLDRNLVYQVKMDVKGGLPCLERFNVIPTLGQIFVFSGQTELIAMARVDEICYRQGSIDYLPRVFPVPKDQLIDPQTKEPIPDWDCCQVDLVSSLNTLLIPCGHVKMCNICANKVTRCPFCKVMVHDRKKMQVIEMEENIDLMEFAKCDSCVKNRITHAVVDCRHYQYLCQQCISELQEGDPMCRLCKTQHLMAKIYI